MAVKKHNRIPILDFILGYRSDIMQKNHVICIFYFLFITTFIF